MGVILLIKQAYKLNLSIPHACGGDPINVLCTLKSTAVFPTHVGVIPLPKCSNTFSICIPHACGGDPSFIGQAQKVMAGIPHACGGDPTT